jgi:hypothetical protein
LSRIASAYHAFPADETKAYVEWAIKFNDLPGSPTGACHVLNKLMRGFGHKFVYDSETLCASLEQAGFSNIVRYDPGISADPHLQNLEMHAMSIGIIPNLFETMVCEANKP